MKIEVQRNSKVSYEIADADLTLLEALSEIKTTQDASLSFSSGCRSSVCGSCSMRVNGKEVLACAYKVKAGDVVEPLKNMAVVRDLVVDFSKAYETMSRAKTWITAKEERIKVSEEDEALNELQSDCILCGSCYSACPVYAVNDDFLGPFALTRAWRYVSDVREDGVMDKIETIQANGIWDCTLCDECTVVCPSNISSKQDIVKLRGKSGILGFMDPNFMNNFGGGGLDFGAPQF